MKTVTVYTDGACSGNPGPGGWGAILEYGPHVRELSGGEAQTTNNRMELTAVIVALEKLKEPCIVELYSDSKYVLDSLEKGWVYNWEKNNWVKKDKKPALNADLWQQLLVQIRRHTVHFHWVKGHADNPKNNRCDQLAVAEIKKFKEKHKKLKNKKPPVPTPSRVADGGLFAVILFCLSLFQTRDAACRSGRDQWDTGWKEK